jgi:hypothetical protein
VGRTQVKIGISQGVSNTTPLRLQVSSAGLNATKRLGVHARSQILDLSTGFGRSGQMLADPRAVIFQICELGGCSLRVGGGAGDAEISGNGGAVVHCHAVASVVMLPGLCGTGATGAAADGVSSSSSSGPGASMGTDLSSVIASANWRRTAAEQDRLSRVELIEMPDLFGRDHAQQIGHFMPLSDQLPIGLPAIMRISSGRDRAGIE